MLKSIALLQLLVVVVCFAPSPTRAQLSQPGPFLGTSCAQGDPSKRTSITTNGAFLTLTNEAGSTSIGHVTGGGTPQIVAGEWSFVRGALSAGGKTISWTDGTFWSRCSSRRHIDLRGVWYFGGDRCKRCRIDRSANTLSLQNESGQSATGSLTSRYSIYTVWSGVTITGTVSRNRKIIYWSNGTYWTRRR